jgi:prophage regulatory protein
MSHENKTIGANPATSERFLRLSEVGNRIPFSRSTIYRLISESKFPRPYSLGEHAKGWKESEINAWIQSRKWVAVELLPRKFTLADLVCGEVESKD